jgi:hypothetical protein
MNDWKKLGWMSVMSLAVFALAGCTRASAESRAVPPARAAAVKGAEPDQRPIADADADKGPGCAESALDAVAQK